MLKSKIKIQKGAAVVYREFEGLAFGNIMLFFVGVTLAGVGGQHTLFLSDPPPPPPPSLSCARSLSVNRSPLSLLPKKANRVPTPPLTNVFSLRARGSVHCVLPGEEGESRQRGG